MWQFYALTSLLAFLVCVFLGIIVYFKNRNNVLNKKFSIVSILIGIWCLFPFLTDIVSNPQFKLLLGRLIYVAAIFTPSVFFDFVFVMLKIHEIKRNKYIIKLSYIFSLLFVLISFSPLLIKNVVSCAPNSYVVPGPFYPLFVVFFISLCPYSIYQIYGVFKDSVGYRKEQLKFLFIGFFIALIGGGMHLFAPYFNTEIFPHDILLIGWSGIIAYAVVRYRLLDIRVAITRAGIFLFVYTLTLGFPFWFAFRTGLWVWALALMAILATLGPFIYGLLQSKAESILLAQQRHYQQILLQASAGMVKEHNLKRLLKLIVYIIRKAVKIRFAAILLEDRESGEYKLKAIRDSKFIYPEISFGQEHPLINYIKEHKEPFTMEEFPISLRNFVETGIEMHLIVPSFIENRLLGFLVLGEKLNKTLYTQDDINVFKTLSNQAALAVENCIFMEEFQRTQERIFNAEKLASIGGMADGVAHQMKNRLNHFSIVAGEQKFELDDFMKNNSQLVANHPNLRKTLEYLKDGSESLILNVKKTSNIIQGILNFARIEQKETMFDEFSLTEVVNQAVELLNVKHQLSEFPVETEIDADDKIYGVKPQIIESMFNLLDNAFEAIKEKIEFILKGEEKKSFLPQIKLKLAQRSRSSIIEISDNGIGIKAENKRKIFAPFFTTKSSYISGSGIGMYVVKRMIEENHKGKIWFESEFSAGTKIFIDLPKKGNKN